jgi:hypothetical protein
MTLERTTTGAGRAREAAAVPFLTVGGLAVDPVPGRALLHGIETPSVHWFLAFLNTAARKSAAMLLGLAMCGPCIEAMAQEDITELKRAVELLQAQNRELTRRLNALEAGKTKQPARNEGGAKPAAAEPGRVAEQPRRLPPAQAPAAAPSAADRARTADQRQATPPSLQTAPAPAPSGPSPGLEERVTQLEQGKAAQESAVRSIIQGSLSNLGPKINEYVSLGGSLETTAGRGSDFIGRITDQIQVSTAELDLQIRANEWMVGTMTVAYESGTNSLFPTTTSFNAPNVDRFTLDKGFVTIGDVQRFPLYSRVGLDYLPFGLSTGVHRNDVLSIVNPLTTEVFQIRKPVIGIGFGLPTPAVGPPPAAITVPQVQPAVIAPLVGSLARRLGYQPSVRSKPPSPYTPPVEPPPFFGMINFYDSSGTDVPNRRVTGNINARLGYQTTGRCDRPYSELQSSWVCPWGFEFTVDYDSSVFDSLFLQSEYLTFLNQIGSVPGLATTVKFNFGPFLLIGEWNSALSSAKFIDGLGNRIRITPSAWQVALAYQFGWNPWVETIGNQGDYVAIGYSQTAGLAGAIQGSGTTQTRVGALPQARLTITAGEWFLENTRLAIEYTHNWDYSVGKGGTGRQADGVFMALTYNW